MPVRRRTDSTPDAWWVDFRVGGVRYRRTVRAKDSDEAQAIERSMRIEMTANRMLHRQALPALERILTDKRSIDRPASRDPWMRLLANARDRAKKKGVAFRLTPQDMERLIVRADGHCELTGLPFSWDHSDGMRKRPFAPSLDRIKLHEGYVSSNVRLVCVAANVAVNEWGEGVFLAVATGYVRQQFSSALGTKIDPSKHQPIEMQ